MQILGQQLTVRGITVEWDLQSDIPKIKADPGRLEQVFINLLINARDAIDEKWQSRQPAPGEKKITFRTRSENGAVAVEICDTGAGIPDDVIDRIFEPFFTTKKVGHGTGLGLSISYGIIQECSGSIKAVPQPDGGTCFIMKFPAAENL
jgi:histidine kinase